MILIVWYALFMSRKTLFTLFRNGDREEGAAHFLNHEVLSKPPFEKSKKVFPGFNES